MPIIFGAFTVGADAAKPLADNFIEGAGAISSAMSSLSTNLTVFAGGILPYVVGIAGAFLVFWLLKLALRVIKSFSK